MAASQKPWIAPAPITQPYTSVGTGGLRPPIASSISFRGLPDGTRLDEGENTGAGEQLVLTESEGFTVGLAICYDLRFPLLFERQRMDGATVPTVPSAFTESTGQAHWHARCALAP